MRLDGYLLGHGLSVLEEGALSNFWRRDSGYGDGLVRKAAEYRRKYPSQADLEVRDTVNAIVSCLLNTSSGLQEPELRDTLRQCYRNNW